MIEATEALELTIKGKKVKIAPEDYYFAEDGTTPVIKHAPLKRLATKFGVKVDEVKVEFPPVIGVDGIPFVAHRAFGRDENGNLISAVGEAGPFNLEGLAANYPVIMSNKRAEDRLLIALLGLEGEIYSEFEIAVSSSSSSSQATSSTPQSTIFPFGKYQGKTLEEIKKADKQYLEWFVNKYQPKTAKDKQLQEKAKEVLAS